MYSKIRSYLKLETQPVAILQAEAPPEGAMMFRDASSGCMMGMLVGASKGRTAAFTESTTGCHGGRAGLGFASMDPDHSGFLAAGSPERPGLRYKMTPELARAHAEAMPSHAAAPCLVLKPLDEVAPEDSPLTVVFLVNPDQLSALITLAHFDRTGDQVRVPFGSGCAQSILFSLQDSAEGLDRCTIGFVDPSARHCVDRDLLSFSIPYSRFLEMEAAAEHSFLSTETWTRLQKRI